MRREAAPSTPSDGGSATQFGYGIYIPALTGGELDYTFSNDTDLRDASVGTEELGVAPSMSA